MEMSEHDIYVEFKNAKDPSKQIQILAELNATTPEAIAEIVNKKRREERKTVTEEEKKAKKAAYMKKYWERKKLEKAAKEAAEETVEPEEAPAPTAPVVHVVEPMHDPDNDGLIRKAVLYYSADLADAVMMQRERVQEEQEKLRQMEADLKRCQEIIEGKAEAKEEGA